MVGYRGHRLTTAGYSHVHETTILLLVYHVDPTKSGNAGKMKDMLRLTNVRTFDLVAASPAPYSETGDRMKTAASLLLMTLLSLMPLADGTLTCSTFVLQHGGLMVETMALSAARYPKPDHRPYIGAALQWRQYLLDVCATVAEVLAADRSIRISNQVKGPGLHVLVLDKTGDRAAIEFLNGHMTVHRGDDLPVAVLTNDTYARSLQCLGEGHPPTFDPYSSITRFITAAKMVQRCRANSTDEMVAFAFDTLAAVASGRTQWRIVYDNQAMMVYYRTRANFRLRHIDVSGFDFLPGSTGENP
jgi:hypothetical protein